MARIKKQLKELFDECKSYGDIFKAMGEAKKLGFTSDEINMAASYRKNSFAKETSNNYNQLKTTEFNMNPAEKFMTTNVQVRDLTSNKMAFDGSVFML